MSSVQVNTSLGKKRSGGDDYCNIYCQQRKDEALQTLNGTVIIRDARTPDFFALPSDLSGPHPGQSCDRTFNLLKIFPNIVMLEKTKIAEWFQPRLKCVDSTLMISTTISTTDIPEPFGSNLLGNRLGPRCQSRDIL